MTTHFDPTESMGDLELAGLAVPERRYAVRDGSGAPWATLVRTPDKSMWWEGPDGRPGLGGASVTEAPLYGSERLKHVPLDVPVILTEGPKDCEAVWRAQLPGVGTMTGAAIIPAPSVLEVLRDRIVLVWPDNDEAGFRTGSSSPRPWPTSPARSAGCRSRAWARRPELRTSRRRTSPGS